MKHKKRQRTERRPPKGNKAPRSTTPARSLPTRVPEAVFVPTVPSGSSRISGGYFESAAAIDSQPDDDAPPATVYRFLRAQGEVDALLAGGVWLSTLERCRAYEEPGRGDPHEAQFTRQIEHMQLDGLNPEHRRIAKSVGVALEGDVHMTMRRHTGVTKIRDAFVLCATIEFKPEKMSEFGGYCVAISHIEQFYRLVTDAVAKEHPIVAARHGRVKYASRTAADTELASGPLGFVKPPDSYQHQQEYRFLWQVHEKIQPRVFNCPDVLPLVRQVFLS